MASRGSLDKYKPGIRSWRPLEEFHKDIGLGSPPWSSRIYRLVLPGARYSDVFLLHDGIIEIVKVVGHRPYTLGLYYGMLFQDRFVPSLPLAQYLAPRADSLGVPTTRVDKEGEKFFLYGKPVFEDHVDGWREGVVLVLDGEGEALGWGRGRIVKISGKRVRLLEPVWDLGWYLRRGG